MFQGSYTREGIQGVLKEGGSGRVDAIGKMLADMGGQLESFYFAFGEDDIVVIAELPDSASAAAVGMAVGAGGGARTRTTILMTAEEVDAASHKTVGYRAPGTQRTRTHARSRAGLRPRPQRVRLPATGSSTHSSGALSGRRPLKLGARIFFVLFVTSR
jgi:uncharacterized protein with GYD domain